MCQSTQAAHEQRPTACLSQTTVKPLCNSETLASASICAVVQYLCVCKQADSDTDTVEGTGSSCCVCGFCSPSRWVSVGSFEAPQRLLVAAGAPIVQSLAMAA